MACKLTLLTLLFLGVMSVALASTRRSKFATPQEMKLFCSYVYNTSCVQDADCQCDYRPARLICNYKKVCNQITILDIMKRIRCPKIFKKHCRSDKDCSSCSGMVCEDHECVNQKYTVT